MSDPFESLPKDKPLADLPPYSNEAEQGMLGCIMLDATACIDEIMQLGITAGHFFDKRHKAIFTSILDVYTANKPVDIVTVVNSLKKHDSLESSGGMTYVSELSGVVPTASNFNAYWEIMHDRWIARRSIEICSTAIASFKDGSKPSVDLVAMLEKDIMGVGGDCHEKKVRSMKEIAVEVTSRLERRFKGERVGVSTGFPDIDKATEGLDAQQLWIIAGRPSCGKTALAVNIGEYIAKTWLETGSDKSVVMFSMEMSDVSIGERIVAGGSEVNLRSMGPATSESELKRVFGAVTKMSKLSKNMVIDDTPGLQMASLMAKARHYHRRNNAGLIIVDYLQLIIGDQKKNARREEVDGISRDLKRLAKELNIPVIALSQLNREVEKDSKRKPRMSDLRESGQIEQDADFIGILYNPNQNQEDLKPSDPRQINLRVCKQRGGGREMDVPLTFIPTLTKFVSLARNYEE